jgi:hypothetical protein
MAHEAEQRLLGRSEPPYLGLAAAASNERRQGEAVVTLGGAAGG